MANGSYAANTVAIGPGATLSIYSHYGDYQDYNSSLTVSNNVTIGNKRLKHDAGKGMFVALVLAIIDPKEKTMTIVNAGQTQPVLCCDESAKAAYIDTEGDRFPLGVIEDCDYQETTVQLKSGDAVVFYTDGIVEAMNRKDELYGFDRFMAVVEKNKGQGAAAFMGSLMADVTGFVGERDQHDDLTIVVVRAE